MSNKLIKSCAFFGHNDFKPTEEIKQCLEFKLQELITKENYSIFYFCDLNSFSYFAWQIVTKFKQKYTQIKRIFYFNSLKKLRTYNRQYLLTTQNCEEINYIDIKYTYWHRRIFLRNTEIINRCSFVIFYTSHVEQVGAYRALTYVKARSIDYLNVSNYIRKRNKYKKSSN